MLQRHAAMLFVHTAIVLMDKSGVPLDVFANEFQEVMDGRALQERFAGTTRNTLCAASTLVRREAYEKAGPFDPEYGLAADRRMWFRLAGIGSVGYVSEPQALILGRSRGDPTERFRLADLRGNHRISMEAVGELWPADGRKRRAIEARLRREVDRDLGVALLKAMIFGQSGRACGTRGSGRAGAAAPVCLPGQGGASVADTARLECDGSSKGPAPTGNS